PFRPLDHGNICRPLDRLPQFGEALARCSHSEDPARFSWQTDIAGEPRLFLCELSPYAGADHIYVLLLSDGLAEEDRDGPGLFELFYDRLTELPNQALFSLRLG